MKKVLRSILAVQTQYQHDHSVICQVYHLDKGHYQKPWDGKSSRGFASMSELVTNARAAARRKVGQSVRVTGLTLTSNRVASVGLVHYFVVDFDDPHKEEFDAHQPSVYLDLRGRVIKPEEHRFATLKAYDDFERNMYGLPSAPQDRVLSRRISHKVKRHRKQAHKRK